MTDATDLFERLAGDPLLQKYALRCRQCQRIIWQDDHGTANAVLLDHAEAHAKAVRP